MKRFCNRELNFVVRALSCVVTLVSIAIPASAEVMDKEMAPSEISRALLLSLLLALPAAAIHRWLLLPLFILGPVQELAYAWTEWHDPSVGESISISLNKFKTFRTDHRLRSRLDRSRRRPTSRLRGPRLARVMPQLGKLPRRCSEYPTRVVFRAMAQAAEKLSITMPHKLASAARKRAGRRGLSSFVAQAVARELERQALGQFLDELDHTLGPVPEAALRRARRAWPKR
jgi:hypothetical protein